ncbi:MAG: dihydrolipoyl dehydrogenase [Thaumarchaeota archaeon]|nr:dihydrolipoyl dehydrogenase [Nitrososphaerota archaeon]
MPRHTDAIVIGAGPGGYVAAIRLAQLGKKVILVERHKLGGECLNYGCIPSKALITASKLFDKVKHASQMGIEVAGAKVDFKKLLQWKQSIVDKLASGIAFLLKANSVEIVYGEAKFLSKNEIEIKKSDGNERISADSFIVATGSYPLSIPRFAIDGKDILSSKEMMELSNLPKRLLVIGGGAIGLELGTTFAKMGTNVIIVEITNSLLPGTDRDMTAVVQRTLEKHSVKVYLKASCEGFTKTSEGLKVSIKTESGNVEEITDKILVSVGRKANIANMNLERLGIELDQRGFVKVNEKMMASVQGIYAIGDITGPPYLAHRASKQGIVAAEVIAGLPSVFEDSVLPTAIFTDPEVASVGLTEEEAKKQGIDVDVARFPFSALGRSLTAGETEGFVKMVIEKEGKRVLGVQVVGPSASDLISECSLALEMGATAEDVALTIHPHPTLPESIMEAAEAVLGKAIHTVNKKKA